MKILLGNLRTLRTRAPLKNGMTHGDTFLANEGYVIEKDGDTVTLTHPDKPGVAVLFPWASCADAEPLANAEAKAAPMPAALGERLDPEHPAPPPVRRVGEPVAESSVPAALLPPSDGSARVATVITAEQAAKMSESALEAAIADGAVVEQAKKARGGWPKGKSRAKAAKDSGEAQS